MNPSGPALRLVLPGPTPGAWLAERLSSLFDDEAVSQAPLLSIWEVVAAGGPLDDAHRNLVREGTPAAAAANYLSGWFGGTVAEATGFVLAAGGGALLLDPGSLRFALHPGGWPAGLTVGQRVAVELSHPWAGCGDVTVVAGADDVVGLAVDHLIEVTTPIVDACRRLAKVGRPGLWNEIGDRLGAALAFQVRVPVTPAMVGVLEAAVARPGAPWRARPRLGFAASARLGTVHVAQKGGCCLAYTAPPEPGVPDDGTSRYCSTCSLRTAEDCDSRQVEWLEAEHARRSGRAAEIA